MHLSKRSIQLICGVVAITVANVCMAADSVPDTSKNVPLGSRTSVPMAFFKMGDMRLINNMWGTQEMNFSDANYTIFVNEDKSFGWEFQRGNCPDGPSHPDYPEVEFGIHPFGVNKSKVTSPDFCSTTILPIQIKDVTSASVKIDNMRIETEYSDGWNMNFEMWFCEGHPITGTHDNAYAEVMAWYGWKDGWDCNVASDRVTAGDKSYTLCHQSDNWGGWRYFQFRSEGGSQNSYSGTTDIKPFLDYLVNQKGYSRDLWISRFEIGTEISNNNKGKLTIGNLTFEVNGVSKSPEFFDPTAIAPQGMPKNNSIEAQRCTVFPAGSTINVFDMRGKMFSLSTGNQPINAFELSKKLPAGVYMVSLAGENGNTVMSKLRLFGSK
jgi:hypothetical protein